MTAASADLRSLAHDLAYASGDGIEKAAGNVIRETAMAVQSIASARAPRDTGKLSSTITIVWISKLEAVISPTEFYGAFPEFGTGARGEFPGQPYEIKPKKPGGVLVFTVGGRTVYARKVTHPGVRAQPYMRPAAKEALEPFTDKLLAAGALLITKGPRSAL